MAEWQPIETAPKDGTRILLCRGQGVVIGFYGPKYSSYGVNYGDAWGVGVEWNHSFNDEPTHWMPLPDPPTTDYLCDICHERPATVKGYRMAACEPCADAERVKWADAQA